MFMNQNMNFQHQLHKHSVVDAYKLQIKRAHYNYYPNINGYRFIA